MTQDPDVRASTSTYRLRAGDEVGGYRLVRRLGAGGMGVVWEASDGDGNHVAMKILHPQVAADPTARTRLGREASVLARVRDPRVARVLDIETGDGPGGAGAVFVVTELVGGPTLQREVDDGGPYDLADDARELADLAHGLVEALKAVHAAGVVHRDLKPSNVMLGAQGPVLIDFGIAQVADDVRLTRTGQVTGTPGFIPPEVLDGGAPGPGVDWYACAGVLLFAVTGHAPFGSGPWQTVFRRVYAGTPELGSLEADSPALAHAFTAALAPEAHERLGVEDLLAVLDEVAEGGSGETALASALAGRVAVTSYGHTPGPLVAGAGPADAVGPVGPAGPLPVRLPVVRSGQERWPEGDLILPEWAREPRPHRLVVSAVAVLLAVLAVWVPAWCVLVAVALTVVAGTVGRADDARRVRRLAAGRASRGDTARMVALLPVYLLRSVAACAAAVLGAGTAAGLLAYTGAAGLRVTEPGALAQVLGDDHRAGVLSAAVVAVFLAVAWFVPWGGPTRRGGRRLIEALTRSGAVRLVLVMALLAAALGVLWLFALGAMPPTTLAPLAP
ncbi:serine/threonine-protein kinase [Actinomyces sp. W5033]|uniref:serine/threonine-protein kinase n=1 Tax=Actinomyces sp. W5033 TaxID=3446479 RepID=UPI003EE36DD3